MLIVPSDPCTDGSCAMRRRDCQAPAARAGDGWFIYNLITNLAQRWQA